MLLKRTQRLQVRDKTSARGGELDPPPDTVATVKRTVFVAIAGLIFAFTFFYAFGWPSTLASNAGAPTTFDKVNTGEILHAGLGPFYVHGQRHVSIVTVRLKEPSPGIELVGTHVALSPTLPGGALRGVQNAIEALPRAPGYVLRPGDAGAFWVTFRVLSPGSFSFRGITITYQSGWLTRSVVLGANVRADTIETPTPSPSPS